MIFGYLENLTAFRPRVTGTSDPKVHDVHYFIMWGDGTNDKWSGPYDSWEEVSFNHKYNKW